MSPEDGVFIFLPHRLTVKAPQTAASTTAGLISDGKRVRPEPRMRPAVKKTEKVWKRL